MSKKIQILKDCLLTLIVLAVCFGICLFLHSYFGYETLIPAIFILASFIVSVFTNGYVYGIFASAISVFLINFAFSFPFFHTSVSSDDIVSAIIIIFISVTTCTLTLKIKNWQRIKAESEREHMRANLLRAVSHDLRTPLTTVYGSSYALLENGDKFTPQQKLTMLKEINSDAEWLCRMVENLLSVTKLDGENVKITKMPVPLDELIDSVLVKFSRRFPDCQVMIDIPDQLIIIPMDPLLIEQVIVNILDNAVTHAKGMTKLCLCVYTPPGKAVFEVRDNGCGIAPDKLKTIFKGAYTESSTYTDSMRRNAGIGLSVCASIIKAHSGEITAHNSKSGGAVFTFILDREEENYE